MQHWTVPCLHWCLVWIAPAALRVINVDELRPDQVNNRACVHFILPSKAPWKILITDLVFSQWQCSVMLWATVTPSCMCIHLIKVVAALLIRVIVPDQFVSSEYVSRSESLLFCKYPLVHALSVAVGDNYPQTRLHWTDTIS